MRAPILLLLAAILTTPGLRAQQPVSSAPVESTAPIPVPARAWTYDPAAGFVYRAGDFKWTSWGYAERLFDPDGPDSWRRVRQGMEIDFRRFAPHYRSAFVYEVDFTDNDFFRAGPKWKIFENLFYAVQSADDAGKFRVLIGENTHILSREDNLSSGNLALVSRALILEEHGSVNSFGTQFGVQMQKALSARNSVSFSAQDNRGSFNTDRPRYHIGNSLAAKWTGTLVQDTAHGRSLNLGLGIDNTRDVGDRTFTLQSAIAGEPLGGTSATGNKLTIESHAAYSDRINEHPYAIESEVLHSRFSSSMTTAAGGYLQGQVSLFESASFGDLVPVLRYDLVRLSRGGAGAATQQALRVGANYNLPHTRQLVNLHLEYARNQVRGPLGILSEARSFDEFRVELRVSATRYTRF